MVKTKCPGCDQIFDFGEKGKTTAKDFEIERSLIAIIKRKGPFWVRCPNCKTRFDITTNWLFSDDVLKNMKEKNEIPLKDQVSDDNSLS
ncbi:MAG TPA: hypothetical protein VKO42_05470 [Patescibacteria group bacterium]|nr:hypothetical protein [Patescibacteria group bacterium]